MNIIPKFIYYLKIEGSTHFVNKVRNSHQANPLDLLPNT